MSDQPIRVLIVDDSRVFRSLIEGAMSKASDIEVVGSAMHGRAAMQMIEENPPDLVTLDMEMPVMDGLATLKAIQQFNRSRPGQPHIGAIMISSLTRHGADVTIEALETGAFDFLTKPVGMDARSILGGLQADLLAKIRAFGAQHRCGNVRTPSASERTDTPRRAAAAVAPAAPASRSTPTPSRPALRLPGSRKQTEAIVIGISTGGPRALGDLMPALCKVVDCPILIVQHMPATFTASLAENLDGKCSYTVVEAENRMPVEKRHAYIAPGAFHLIPRGTAGGVFLTTNDNPPEEGCRPSANILFRAAAKVWGSKQIALILTGMGSDGAKGLAEIKAAGAYVIAQDEASSVVWGMPGSAVQAGVTDEVLPLMEIPKVIESLIMK